jgi:hypothetical protein
MDYSVYCRNEKSLAFWDSLSATIILAAYFVIGSLGNLLYICIYLHKQRRRLYFESNKKSLKAACIRFKNQVNNKAIYTLSISNVLLSFVFIPYTILFRVWYVFTLNPYLIKFIEHMKDSLLYLNLLVLIILSIERYVAVCKPQYYKNLETNINKIFWIFFLVGLVFGAANYQNSTKSGLECKETMINSVVNNNNNDNNTADFSHFIYQFDRNKNKLNLNLNLLTSVFLFTLSACISTSFYVKIGLYEWKRSQNFSKNCNPDARLAQHVCKKLPKPVAKSGECLNENENEDEQQTSGSYSKSNVSVQTDFTAENRIYFRKQSTIITAQTITKISIWVRRLIF